MDGNPFEKALFLDLGIREGLPPEVGAAQAQT